MARYTVMLDKGVKIGDKVFTHGSVVDSDKLVPDLKLPPEPRRLKDEVKNAEAVELHQKETVDAKSRHEDAKRRAASDYDGHLKSGVLEPAKASAPEAAPVAAKEG